MNTQVTHATWQSPGRVVRKERPYQRRDKGAILASIAAHQCSLYVLPTGGGKTFVFGAVAKHFVARGNRVCIVVHKTVLTDQTVASIAASIGVPESSIGTLANGKWTSPDAAVLVCMAQSLASKIERGECDHHFGLVILDEAHRSLAKTHRTIVDHFKAKQAAILGVTATSERLDRIRMSEIYTDMVRGPSFAELTDLGFIARPIYYAPTKDLLPRLKGAKKSGKDYSLRSISKPCIAVVGGLVKQWKRRAPKEGGTLIFAVDIEHAKAIAVEFRAQGVRSVEVATSEDPVGALASFNRLKLGVTKIVINVMIAVEGFDAPGISCLMIARPTLSRGLHIQMLGRALRKVCGCERRCEHPRPVVLDHTTNTSIFGKAERYHAPGLDEEPEPPGFGAKTVERGCPGCGGLTLATGESCEECGRAFKDTDKREVVTVDGELVEFDDSEPVSRPESHECMCGCGLLSTPSCYQPSRVASRVASIGSYVWVCKRATEVYRSYRSRTSSEVSIREFLASVPLNLHPSCAYCGVDMPSTPKLQRRAQDAKGFACRQCATHQAKHLRKYPGEGSAFRDYVKNRTFLRLAYESSGGSCFSIWWHKAVPSSRGIPAFTSNHFNAIDMSAAIEAVRRGLPEDK